MEYIYEPSYTMLKILYKRASANIEDVLEKKITVKGWIRSVRKQKDLIFIQLYDGSHVKPLQLLVEENKKNLREEIEPKLHIGACIEVFGKIVKSPASGQLIELVVENCNIIGEVKDPDSYLPGIKNVPQEYPRRTQHLRPKFRSYASIYRIRSYLLKVIHEYFHSRDFLNLDPNICTKSDCEGAGETFTVTSILKTGNLSDITVKDNSDVIDFSNDFFGEQTYLTVSSQLQLEALCCGMGPVYTMNPSFRAEKSKTKRHLACFTHLEWEIPFINLKQLKDFSEDLVTYCLKKVLDNCRDDLEELNKFYAKGLIEKLESFVRERFGRITYDEAIEIIHNNEARIKEKFGDEVKELPKWGDDLGSYCERFLAEEIFKKPIFVYNYPKDLKSFYMKQNESSDEHRKTCQSCDLLVPYLGELIGSSIRTSDYNELLQEIKRRNMDPKQLDWYLDLRKNGGTYTGGAGLGFERLVTICTSMEGNIRDALPFPVAYEECYY